MGLDSVVLGLDSVVLGLDSVVLGLDWVVLGLDLVALRALALRGRINAIRKMTSYSGSYDLGQTINRLHQLRFMMCSLAQPI